MLLRDEEKIATKKKSWTRILYLAVFVIALCVLLFSLLQIFSYFLEGKKQQDFNESMIEEGIVPITPKEEPMTNSPQTAPDTTPNETSEPATSQEASEPVPILTTPDISVNFDKLSSQYPNIVGWLYMQGGVVHNPVMQAKDNDYYLYRLPNGKKNSAGSLFMDYRDSASLNGWNHLVYGHNMKNGSMFGILHNYRSAGYFERHPYLFYFTPSGSYRVELFAGIHTLSNSFVYTHPSSDAAKQNYLNEALSRSVFTANVSVGPQDKILVLSTCSGAVDSDNRFVVLGKLVPLS